MKGQIKQAYSNLREPITDILKIKALWKVRKLAHALTFQFSYHPESSFWILCLHDSLQEFSVRKLVKKLHTTPQASEPVRRGVWGEMGKC